MSDVFLSYAREDQPAAKLVAKQLKDAGLSVFLDSDALVAGDSWSERIRSELQRTGAVLLLLSAHSQRKSWVQDELQAALENKRAVVPVLLDSEATHNWLWPLVATRQSVSLDPSSPGATERLAQLVERLRTVKGESGDA